MKYVSLKNFSVSEFTKLLDEPEIKETTKAIIKNVIEVDKKIYQEDIQDKLAYTRNSLED